MILFPLRDEQDARKPIWQFFAIGRNNDQCELLEFLSSFPEKTQEHKAASALIAVIKRLQYEISGPMALKGTPYCHEAISGQQVYEFRKMSLRLYWFYGVGEKIIICAYGIEKRHPKTSKEDRKRLIELRNMYLADVQAGCIQTSDRRKLP